MSASRCSRFPGVVELRSRHQQLGPRAVNTGPVAPGAVTPGALATLPTRSARLPRQSESPGASNERRTYDE